MGLDKAVKINSQGTCFLEQKAVIVQAQLTWWGEDKTVATSLAVLHTTCRREGQEGACAGGTSPKREQQNPCHPLLRTAKHYLKCLPF